MALTNGTRLGPYEIAGAIGAGGMGEVYRARDLRLQRDVALKVLPELFATDPDRLARFEGEARAIAALSHPNILAVYDLGRHHQTVYIVMELLEGQTLRQRLAGGGLPVRKALEIAGQIASGIAAAHTRGIVHRDLKPENVFLTREGHVKILDFGLAKAAPVPLGLAVDADMTAGPQTEQGVVFGTAGYMAPEQVRGLAVDHRADIFALGAILYEMLSGRRAFRGDTAADTMSAVLKDDPPSVSRLAPATPPGLTRIVQRCLEKEPEERFGSARDLGFALESISDFDVGLPASQASPAGLKPALSVRPSTGSGRTVEGTRPLAEADAARGGLQPTPSPALRAPSPPRSGGEGWGEGAPAEVAGRSVAVLPFTNVGADPENEAFSDGLAEELINALARLPGLHVAARTSAFRFRARDADIREIGRQLNVDSILDGSVRRAGKRLRITAQLISVADGYYHWSERYDRELADVFDIQDEITQSIIRTLQPALLGRQESLARRHSENLEAFELYLKGRNLWHQRTPQAIRAAIAYYEEAIKLDPNYALPYAGLADSYTLLAPYGYRPYAESAAKAEPAARRAMSLDPTAAESLCAMGLFTFCFAPDWRAAEDFFKRAIALQPRFSSAQVYYAALLATRHRFDDALVQAAKATEVDPLSPFTHAFAGLTMYIARQYERAVASCARAVELQPDFALGLWLMGMAYCRVGQYDRAVELFERVVALSQRAAMFVGMLGLACGLAGHTDEAKRLLDELLGRSTSEYVYPFAFLVIHLGLADRDKTYDAFEACVKEGWTGGGFEFVLGPYLDDLATDPRFAALFERLRLMPRPA